MRWSRTLVSAAIEPDSPLPASMVTSQEVRVYQSYNGKQLFRIDLTPVERSGQNFALSPDGLRIAAVRQVRVRHAATKDYDAYTQIEAGVEVYSLPPLNDDDQVVVKKTEALAPQDTGARIDLSLERVSSGSATAAASEMGGADTSTATQAPDKQAEAAPAPAAEGDAAPAAGDSLPDAPRKPPTLYGPDEKPAGKPQ